jgi:hypothetical protein
LGKRGWWNNDRELVQIFTLRTFIYVTIAISMMGTRSDDRSFWIISQKIPNNAVTSFLSGKSDINAVVAINHVHTGSD